MTFYHNRLFSSALSLLLIFAVFSSALLLRQKVSKPEDKMIVRQIELAAAPPPPPPPVTHTQSQDHSPSIDLSVDGVGPALAFEQVNLKAEMKLEKLQPELSHSLNTNLLANLDVDWQAFGLSELDEMPKLLTSLNIVFPKALERRGIYQVAIELDVLIDERGDVVLRRVIQNDYPEMQSVIQALVKKARFTAPKKDGVPVRASFNWPLELAST